MVDEVVSIDEIISMKARIKELVRDLEQANRERLDWKRWLLESEQQVKSLSEQLVKAKE